MAAEQFKIDIRHSVLSMHSQKYFGGATTISQLKQNLHRTVGTPVEFMKISFKRAVDESPIFEVQEGDNSKDGLNLQEILSKEYEILSKRDTPVDPENDTPVIILDIEDKDPNKLIEDIVTQNPSEDVKFKISEEAYNKKSKARQYKEEMLANTIASLPYKVNDTIKVVVKGQPERQGTIRYIGKIEGNATPLWIGVEFQDAVGKNDGSTGGNRYFECKPNHGSFCKPENIAVLE